MSARRCAIILPLWKNDAACDWRNLHGFISPPSTRHFVTVTSSHASKLQVISCVLWIPFVCFEELRSMGRGRFILLRSLLTYPKPKWTLCMWLFRHPNKWMVFIKHLVLIFLSRSSWTKLWPFSIQNLISSVTILGHTFRSCCLNIFEITSWNYIWINNRPSSFII
jgi:hypothetical protein